MGNEEAGTGPAGPSKRTILGVTWRSGEPMARVRDDGDNRSHLVPLIGLDLRYRATGRRVCLGHTPVQPPGAGYQDCHRRALPGSRRCGRCTSLETAFAASLHHAHVRDRRLLDPAIAEHLQQPNHLYIAAFRDGSFKVGTSTQHRTTTRLAEQGAWLAEIVAEASNGFAIRELEDMVTEIYGVTQAVSVSRKMAGMLNPSPDEVLERHVAVQRPRVHALVERLNDEVLSTAAEPWSAPMRHDPAWAQPHRYPRDLAEGAHDVEVVAAVGRVVALARVTDDGLGQDRFLADIRTLYGTLLELGEHETNEIVVQDSLF